jgi:two-component system, LuxR family, sensor kinase FixL
MTGPRKRASLDATIDERAAAPTFLTSLARWLNFNQDGQRSARSKVQFGLVDRLMSIMLLTAAGLSMFAFFDIAREQNVTHLHFHHGAMLLLLAATAGLTIAWVVQLMRQRAHERSLQEERERVISAAATANLGLWGWDRNSDKFWMTSACMAMLNLAPQTGTTLEGFLSLVHPDDQPGVRITLRRAIEQAGPHEYLYRHSREGGELRWYRLRVSARDDASTLSGCIMDVTEAQHIQAELESQRKSLTHLERVTLLGELGGALAHELRQPLTAILSNAQALQRLIDQRTIDMAEVRAVIRDIIQDDSRAADVIQHLRSLLRPGEFQGKMHDLNSIVLATLSLVRNDMMVHRVAISTSLHGHALMVMADTVQLQQLLLNLLFNAAEAAGNGGMVLITTDTMVDGAAHIAIADTGPGIKTEVMEKLFEPFISTKIHGLGLGLSISRAIAIAHKGRIWAENNSGRGATFHVTLPRTVT